MEVPQEPVPLGVPGPQGHGEEPQRVGLQVLATLLQRSSALSSPTIEILLLSLFEEKDPIPQYFRNHCYRLSQI